MNKEKFVLKQVSDLSSRLGIPAPEVLFKNTEDLRLKRNYLGRCDQKANMIIVKLRGQTPKSLKHTVAHELIHLAFPKLNHGIRFEQYIEALLRGHMAFDGRGLVTTIQKPLPGIADQIVALVQRQKKIDTKIKRLITARKKVLRRLAGLKRKEATQQ